MNSSISTSDAGWRRLLRRYAAWSAGIALTLALLIVALDPYDTGRLALVGPLRVPPFGQRLSVAALARQPDFTLAIIGNSTLQLIDPARIGRPAYRALSLTVPGTGPLEQLAVARWFVRHHGGTPIALAIGLDGSWCVADRPLALANPFPFWLYRDDTVDYLVNLMQYQTLESAVRKLRGRLGHRSAGRSDGYNDYDAGRTWSRTAFHARLGTVGEDATPTDAAGPARNITAAPLLTDFLAGLPQATPVILVVPPQFAPDRADRQACIARFTALAGERPHTTLLNFLTRRDLTASEDDYWDRIHYRAPVARQMEAAIDATLATLE
jgi:hypothetical protein